MSLSHLIAIGVVVIPGCNICDKEFKTIASSEKHPFSKRHKINAALALVQTQGQDLSIRSIPEQSATNYQQMQTETANLKKTIKDLTSSSISNYLTSQTTIILLQEEVANTNKLNSKLLSENRTLQQDI
jgi:hypothetical protein